MRNTLHYSWIPSVFFAQGVPYAVMAVLSLLFYHSLHVDNTLNTLYSSLLLLPWAISPLWAAWLERFTHKRRALLCCQLLQLAAFIALPLCINHRGELPLSFCLFLCVAFLGATYDIFSSGYYLHKLTIKQQSQLIGIRTLFYQLGRISVQGGLLVLLGILLKHFPTTEAWTLVFCTLALYGLIILILHLKLLPHELNINEKRPRTNLRTTLSSFLNLTGIVSFIGFTLLYNAPEAELQRILPLYLIGKSGLGLTASHIGLIYGTGGTLMLLLGVFISGKAAARKHVSYYILPFSILTSLSQCAYLLLYIQQPTLISIMIIILFSQLCFGMSNGIYMQALMIKVTKHSLKMSYYAFLTAIMALSFSLFGAAAGYLQALLGSYKNFFYSIIISGALVCLMTYCMVRNNETFSS